MKTLHSYIADPTGSEPVEPLTVVFDKPQPEFTARKESGLMFEGRSCYRRAAAELLDAMQVTCSQGFMDALLGELLYRKSIIFRVPLRPEESTRELGAEPAVSGDTVLGEVK